MCHGVDGSGRVGANLEAFPGIQADAAIREVISSGIEGGPMPAWSQANGGPLSNADIEDITAYLIGVLDGTEPVAPAPEYTPPDIPPLHTAPLDTAPPEAEVRPLPPTASVPARLILMASAAVIIRPPDIIVVM